MGIVLLPVYLLTFLIWIFALIFFLLRASDGHMAKWWSLALGAVISFLIYLFLLYSWSLQDEVWGLQSYFIIPLFHAVFPGLLGLGGIYIPKDKTFWNVLGFSFCFASIIPPFVYLFAPYLLDADTFIDIKLTY